MADSAKHISLLENAVLGSAKANGREPKTCLGRVFSYKLGCFDDVHVLIYLREHMPTFYSQKLSQF